VRTLREVEFLRVLDHPNIVKLLAVLPSPSPAHVDDVCLVLERVQTGISLIVTLEKQLLNEWKPQV
jgi:hypothetical protein